MSQETATLSLRGSAPWIDKLLDANSVAQEVAKRLRTAIDRVGGNKGIMAKTGMPSRTLSEYLAGGEMKRGALIAIADACGVHIAWLAAGRGPMLITGNPMEMAQQAIRQAAENMSRGAQSQEPQKSALDYLDQDRLRRAIKESIQAATDRDVVPDADMLARVTLIYYAAFTREDEASQKR